MRKGAGLYREPCHLTYQDEVVSVGVQCIVGSQQKGVQLQTHIINQLSTFYSDMRNSSCDFQKSQLI